MKTKTESLPQVRVTEDDKRVIADAAAKVSRTVSDFVRLAALKEANKILSSSDTSEER